MRSKRKQEWSDVPSRDMISRAHAAALHLKKSQGSQVGDLGQFGSCMVWGNVEPDNNGPISGSPDMSDVRKYSNYSKWEVGFISRAIPRVLHGVQYLKFQPSI